MNLNLLTGAAVAMAAMGSLAVYHVNHKIDQLLYSTASLEDRVTASLEDRVLAVEQARPKIEIHRTDQRITFKNLDVFCLAKNIFHEAGIEDRLGKYAVAQVTLNRMRHPGFPNTVCDVVMHRKQFSWANDLSVRWTHPSGQSWEESKQIAEQVLVHGYRVRGLETAIYYHADYVNPFWKKAEAKITKIGTHIFYARAR